MFSINFLFNAKLFMFLLMINFLLGCYGALKESPKLLYAVSKNNFFPFSLPFKSIWKKIHVEREQMPFKVTGNQIKIIIDLRICSFCLCSFCQFAFLLAIIFIIEIAVGIAAITFRNDLEGILNTQLRQSMIRQNKVSIYFGVPYYNYSIYCCILFCEHLGRTECI